VRPWQGEAGNRTCVKIGSLRGHRCGDSCWSSLAKQNDKHFMIRGHVQFAKKRPRKDEGLQPLFCGDRLHSEGGKGTNEEENQPAGLRITINNYEAASFAKVTY